MAESAGQCGLDRGEGAFDIGHYATEDVVDGSLETLKGAGDLGQEGLQGAKELAEKIGDTAGETAQVNLALADNHAFGSGDITLEHFETAAEFGT